MQFLIDNLGVGPNATYPPSPLLQSDVIDASIIYNDDMDMTDVATTLLSVASGIQEDVIINKIADNVIDDSILDKTPQIA